MPNSNHFEMARRHFLRNLVAAPLAVGAIASSSPVKASPQLHRAKGSHFQLSLAAYSFSQQMVRQWPKANPKPSQTNLSEVIDFCAEQNLDGVELTSYYFPNPLTTETLLSLKAQCFHQGLTISGTAIGNDFCLPEGPAREKEFELCKLWIDYAAMLGAPVIRIFAGKVPKGDSEEAAVERCVDGINKMLDYAATKGVALALENHHGITSTGKQLVSIVEKVKSSPWFGVNFDSGNFHTEDPYRDLEMIAPYTINAQLKVVMKPLAGSAVDADFGRIIKILRNAGYRGFLVLEYEEKADPRVEVPKILQKLRELI